MDPNVMTNMISSVGFPIAACAAMFWYIYKTDARHDDEVDKLRGVLEQNTLAIQKLCDRLEVKQDDK